MKIHFYLLPLLIISFIPTSIFSQSLIANKYIDTAVAYQNTGKNYAKALKYYELAIKEGNDGNYTYYYAAQCSCQCGQTEKAITYYKKSVAKFIDFYNYVFFSTDTLNKCFSTTPEWKVNLELMKHKYDSVTAIRTNYLAAINDSSKRLNNSELTDSLQIISIVKNKNPKEVINWIKKYNNFPTPPKKNQGAIYTIKVNDSLSVPFFVYVPEGYDFRKKNKLYVFLHGGVGQRPTFNSSPMLYEDDKKILKKPISKNAIIIYPLARKGFNWLYNITAFETILKEISFVKSLYNIDDNRVYIGGHSNGGTGAFWMATHKPTYFASFLGLNYDPRSYFDNTNLGNLRNESRFYGINGTDDATFNINNVNNIKDYGISIGCNWQGFTIKGDHGLPFDDPQSTYFVYDSLFSQVRNPFPKMIQWETDNIKNGKYYWLEITKLDSSNKKADWQKSYNPPSIIINGETIDYKFNPLNSAAIKASIKNNTITIEQSGVTELVFYASPELVDLDKPVKIYVNNKLVFNKKINEDRQVILDEFMKTKDRSLVVVNKVKILF